MAVVGPRPLLKEYLPLYNAHQARRHEVSIFDFGCGIWAFECSAVIETGQLVLCRGLFEWDDILHNGLGCMAGSLVIGIIFRKIT